MARITTTMLRARWQGSDRWLSDGGARGAGRLTARITRDGVLLYFQYFLPKTGKLQRVPRRVCSGSWLRHHAPGATSLSPLPRCRLRGAEIYLHMRVLEMVFRLEASGQLVFGSVGALRGGVARVHKPWDRRGVGRIFHSSGESPLRRLVWPYRHDLRQSAAHCLCWRTLTTGIEIQRLGAG